MLSVARNNAFKIFQNNRKWNLLLRNLSQQELLPWVTIDKEGRKAEVIIPGYSYGDLDRVAVWNVTKWLQAITHCRHLTWDHDFLQMNTKLRQEGMTFITGVRLLASKAETSWAAGKSEASAPGLHFTISLGNVGTSSFETNGTVKLTDKENCQVVVSYSLFWVYVDRKSRRVSRLPDWFLSENVVCRDMPKTPRINIMDYDALLQHTSSQLGSICKVHQRHFAIHEEDIDKFQHTNHEVYISFLMETVQEYFVQSDGQWDCMGVGAFEVLYRGESKLGDELCVEVWKDGNRLIGYVLKMDTVLVLSHLELKVASASSRL